MKLLQSNLAKRLLHVVKFQEKYTKLLSKIRNISTTNINYTGNFIIKSRFPDVERVTGTTVPEFVWSSFQSGNWKKSIAFECPQSGAKITHEELYRTSKSFATSLLQSGLTKRDVVAIALPNTIHYASILLGTMDAGLIPTTVNPAYTPDEIKRQLLYSNAKCIVTIPQLVPVMRSFMKSNSELKSIIVLGDEVADGCHSYKEIIKTEPNDTLLLKGSSIDTTEEIAMLPFSSGTTGIPKGVSLTHSNIVTHLKQLLTPGCLTIKYDGERFIGVLPFFHVYGYLTFLIVGPIVGANTVCLPRFDPETYLNAVRNHKPTILHTVTPLLIHMVNNPEYGEKELSSLHTIVGGAMPIGKHLVEKLLQKAGKYIFFQEVYGLTEASPGLTALSADTKNTRTGSCGRLIAGTVAKIVATDGSGKILGPNERGELCVKGPQVMKGYWKNEAATNEMIDSEGWLHTGDILYYDNEEYFYVVDRLKDLIKYKGFQVAPAELEDLLRQHPSVAEAAVIGIPDEEAGELPMAFLVPRESGQIDPNSVHEFINAKISHHKQLKGGIEIIASIPKAPSGKILRNVLKTEYYKKHNIPLP